LIDVTNAALYRAALLELQAFKNSLGRQYRGRFVQLFLAMKFHQNELPSMFSGQFVSTEVLQTLIDDLYAKASRPANHCVLMLFENRYHARTGLISPGNNTAQNTWRNNFNLQKGVGCFAPPQDLASQTFLDESRAACRYLQPQRPGVLTGATCQLCLTGARYRNEDHRKWLRIEPNGGGYAVVDLLNTRNFVPYVVPGGVRIPIVPAMAALYHDALPGLVTATRTQVDVPDFASDFNFSAAELATYFDDSTANQYNRSLLTAFPGATYTAIGAGPAPVAPRAPARARPPRAARGGAGIIPQPVLTGTPVPPPGVNTGWDAEQYVASALRAAGWTVYDVSRQHLGYDLLAQLGRQTRYVDVKSSLGHCTPVFTSREWQQAQAHGPSYVLAVIENFNPMAQNAVYWIPDPAGACIARQATVIQYSVSRTAWQAATVALNSI
jgi:hypothetical protein